MDLTMKGQDLVRKVMMGYELGREMLEEEDLKIDWSSGFMVETFFVGITLLQIAILFCSKTAFQKIKFCQNFFQKYNCTAYWRTEFFNA